MSQRSDTDRDNLGARKKRKVRHTRVKTGCRDCRMRRIKCPEGILVAEGAKLPCEKCDETGTTCWYPAPDDSGRAITRWIPAAVLDEAGRVVATIEGPTTLNQDIEDVTPTVPDLPTRLHSIHDHSQHLQQGLQQPPIPVYQEIKHERPPTPIQQHFSNPEPLPRFLLSDTPPAGPSYQGPRMLADSSSRHSRLPTTVLLPSAHSYPQHPPIEPRHLEAGLTLPRIPKGIRTLQHSEAPQWHDGVDMGNFPVRNNHPYASAPATYNVPTPATYGIPGPSSRMPYTGNMSAFVPTEGQQATYRQSMMLPRSRQGTTADGFPLQMTRIPYMKRKPMHVDHTKPTGRRSQAALDALMETGAAAASPLVIADNLHRYLASVNLPVRPLRSFTLASISASPLEQMAMAYFETRGCMDLVAVGEVKSNWIYVQVFPRVYDLLATSFEKGQRPGAMPKRSKSSGTEVEMARVEARQYIKEYVHHSLIRLSCVHRANTESEPSRIAALRQEVRAHEKQAMRAGLMARIHFPESAWKTEEYL
jgi:hypothetical protein